MDCDIVILESAETDLKQLKSYLTKNFSPETWQNSFGALKKSIRNLKAFPYSGHFPDELEKLNLTQYRQIISGMNRIIYEVPGDTVFIHVIVDGRRDLASLLTRRLLRGSTD